MITPPDLDGQPVCPFCGKGVTGRTALAFKVIFYASAALIIASPIFTAIVLVARALK
jgi:hypothetical protein